MEMSTCVSEVVIFLVRQLLITLECDRVNRLESAPVDSAEIT